MLAVFPIMRSILFPANTPAWLFAKFLLHGDLCHLARGDLLHVSQRLGTRTLCAPTIVHMAFSRDVRAYDEAWGQLRLLPFYFWIHAAVFTVQRILFETVPRCLLLPFDVCKDPSRMGT